MSPFLLSALNAWGREAVQLVWWWNPLVWWTHARIRQLRETAVDEAVMLATNPETSEYPAALVAMARHCLVRPALTLNFLGILESPCRLERRVRRLLERPLPRTARLGWGGCLIVVVAAAGAVPMGFDPRTEAASAARAVLPETRTVPGDPVRPVEADPPPNAGAPNATQPGGMHTRQYRLEASTLAKLLNETAATPIPAGQDGVQTQLQLFLARHGLEFPLFTPGQPSLPEFPAAFINTNTGTLFVRATLADQNRLERTLQRLNQQPQQILLECRFVEGDLGTVERLNLDWETSAAMGSTTNPTPVLRLTAAATAELVAQLKASAGFEILSTPKVTTLSGRQAQVAVAELKTVVTGQSNSVDGPVTFTTKLATGPSVDLTAVSDPEQPSLFRVTAAGQVVEFLGYEAAKVPKPLIRTNAAQGSARLWDGQTLVLQLPRFTNTVQMIDRVPYLSDLPLVGRLFTYRGSGTVVRQRLVLVTPMLIDPAGQRLHDPKHPLFDPAKLP